MVPVSLTSRCRILTAAIACAPKHDIAGGTNGGNHKIRHSAAFLHDRCRREYTNPRGHSATPDAVSRTAMDREINLDSIRALEKQIQEHERAIIQLKRARNSLLNVSTLLPPEVLGSIFRWNVIPDGDFGGLPKASYNFLLVCHHWFQVASGTPGFGVSGAIRFKIGRVGTLVVEPLRSIWCWDGTRVDDLDDTLRDALQDRAARDTIRRVHLEGTNAELLNSVISSIITKGEETRSISVESFILQK
jgi:hypothetical protein